MKDSKKKMTPEEELLRSYSKKMVGEGILKSVVLGLICGFALSAIVSVVSFATLYNALWIALAIWGGSAVGLSVLFYFLLFRPKLEHTAARVDGVGLDERVITMVEFANKGDEDNVLLRKQREDTRQALSTVQTKQVKIGVPKLFAILLAVVAVVSVFMVSFSTARAVQAEEQRQQEIPVDPDADLSEEDKIIKQMIEHLREIIDEAEISEQLRSELHAIVDDLEARLDPSDPLSVKVAQINDTAEEIHRLIEEYLNRPTIGEELQKYDPTRPLGEAIDTWDPANIEGAIQKMYDDLVVLVDQQLYDYILETALDIDKALEDAKNTPEKLQKALEDLRDAYLAVLKSQEEMTDEEMKEELKDALDQAMDAIQDAMQDYLDSQEGIRDNMENLDDDLQDAIKDAMDQLGQDFDKMPGDPMETPDGTLKPGEQPLPGEDTEGEGHLPSDDGDDSYGKVIDGETSYKDVIDDYNNDAQDKMESGDLDEDTRDVIQDFFDMLN